MIKENLSYEQLRTFVLEGLSRLPKDQLPNLSANVAIVLQEKGLNEFILSTRFSGPSLRPEDLERVQDIFWDLMVEGFVRPGRDASDLNLPFYHLTELGRRHIKDGDRSPYDPDGYLKRLQQEVPSLDAIILTYLIESLHTFRINCLLSSAITLGCASEKALLAVIDTYAEALQSPKKDMFLKKVEGQQIRRQYEEFQKMLEGHLRALLPGELKENLDTALTTIFNLFRTHRNEAGHPTGKVLNRELQYSHIVAFPMYVRKIYELINWLKSHRPLT